MPLKTDYANGDQLTATAFNTVTTAVNAAYVKPGSGIPSTDLTSAVQTSLGRADSAVQSVSSTSITDSTSTGRAVLTAADAATARTTLGVAYGTTAGTVAQGNDSRFTPSSTSISDSTATGRALITTTDASTARTTLGVAYGTSAGTVAQGNDSRITGAVASGGALGTPSSGTLTNCTGLPVAGITGTLTVGSGGSGATTLSGVLKGNGTSAFTAATAGTDYVAPSGALGTPSSGTLTNCTSLPVSGITASTSAALGVGTVELGHASDTTLSRSAAGVLAVEGVNVLLNGGALGTPSSGTLTNATGLPVSGITASTSAALGVGTVELGHASDTTLSRSAAGILAVEGVDQVNVSSAQTLTSKRITPRIGTVASSATPSIDIGLYDQYNITALAAAITGVTITGTPTDGQKLLIRIKDNATARAITWGSSFSASGAAALLTTTVVSKTHLAGFIYDSVAAKWICVASDSSGY